MRIIALGLVLLAVIASNASAQDMPDLVRIDLTFTPPTNTGSVRLFGSELWQQGVGYYVVNPGRPRWQTTGIIPGSLGGPFIPALGGFVDLFGGANGNVGILLENPVALISVYFLGAGDGKNPPTLKPGEYDTSLTSFSEGGTVINFNVHPDGGYQRIVAVPELSFLRRHALSFLGPKVAALANPTLQRITAVGAAALLGAPRDGVAIRLPHVTLDVSEWCGGLIQLKWLMLFSLLFGLVVFGVVARLGVVSTVGLTGTLMLIAVLTSVEANILRVAATGLGLEWYGVESRYVIKEWTGWGAIAFGVSQVIVAGIVMNTLRRARNKRFAQPLSRGFCSFTGV